MPNIVGIVGFKGSGKDTVGNFIVDSFGYGRDSFANPLKDLVASVFGWPRRMLEGDTPESREWREQPDEWWERELDWSNHKGRVLSDRFTPRIALQLFGTEVLRVGFHNDIWILSLKNRVRQAGNIVVTDCRFPNEIKAIRELGGKVIRVKRGPEPDWYETAEAANSDTFLHAPECAKILHEKGIHISEWAWIGSKYDYVFENDGSLEDLQNKVRAVFT